MKIFSTIELTFSLRYASISIITFLSFFCTVLYGQDPGNISWVKQGIVLDVGAPGSWDCIAVGNPCVILENDTFKMWHAGYDGNTIRIGYATSLNGVTWTKDTIHSPVLDVGAPFEWDDYAVNWPAVVFANGIYHMWYAGFSDPGICLIGHATSPDGLVWTKDPSNPVLEQGPSGWDSYWVDTPFIIFENDTFHLWYSGGSGSNLAHIGYATTTNPNGKNWTKYYDNPVLSPTFGNWDYPRVECPSIATYNDTLYMFYSGGISEQHDIGFATSVDKVTWYKEDPNPCLLRGPAGSWDDYDVFASYVINDGNKYKIWYRGKSSATGEVKIGLATTPDTLNVPGEYSTIQEAIDAAMQGDVVLVAEGTYYENINFKGKAITVASHFLVDGDTSHISNTIIDGSQPTDPDSASVVTFRNGEDTNSVICGFTITGGTGTIIMYIGLLRRYGGGVLAYYSDANIQHNIIESNSIHYTSDSFGGGICGFYGNYIIENNTIRNNEINASAIVDWCLGGGIYTYSFGYVRIVNNKILNNTITAPEAWGGGIIPAGEGNDNYFILNNLISGNTLNATTGGSGGIDIYNHSPTVMNNVIVNNSAPTRGGGAVIENGNPVFINNTIAYNTSTGRGGGLDIVGSNPLMMNSILWGNTALIGPQIFGSATVVYSDVEGGYDGINNIDLYPEFMDTLNFDFQLKDNSPCIGAGIDSLEIGGTWYYCPPFCYYGNPRPNPPGSMPDIGACESSLPNPVGVEEDLLQIPEEYSLEQNYPNPFNPSTIIKYGIKERTNVELKVIDVLGREIETLVYGEQNAGHYELEFNASTLASGVYFYRLQAGEFVETKKMLLLK